jgi:hypothetical protein
MLIADFYYHVAPPGAELVFNDPVSTDLASAGQFVNFPKS